MAEQKFRSVVVLFEMFVEFRHHQPNQFPQKLQVLVDVIVRGGADENRSLHESHEAPERF